MTVTVEALAAELAASDQFAVRTVLPGDGSLAQDVLDVTHDSRSVSTGWLFCCVPGAGFDGHDFAEAALESGAVALLVERRLEGTATLRAAPQIVVDSVRAAMGPCAAIVHDHPSRDLTVIGVTGTNGKTSVVHLLDIVLTRLGNRVETIGTLSGARTTPEGPDLQRQLANARNDKVDVVAMEVSSHALDMHRVDGTRFAAVIFTNLGHDHLDYHGTVEAYFAAKARLFVPAFTELSVLNLDDPRGRELELATSTEVIGYRLSDVTDLIVDGPSSRFTWNGLPVELRLAGEHNVSNALAVAAVAKHLGHDTTDIADALCAVDAPRGRFEFVNVGQSFHVVVDYAHKPEALKAVLGAARSVAGDHRVLLVVGCGGDRDREKRPMMAAIAEASADVVVLTSDNPRSEDPSAIIADMVEGLRDAAGVHIELDRADAISHAIDLASDGDVVLIAGKGHEDYQVIGDEVIDFDDRLVAAQKLTGVPR
jgi:UDP-N-acetylmuramoyl-L-alanyl-D-glutamate--2,6-diaminopimelate ligase